MKLESTIRNHPGMLYTAPVLDAVLLLLVFFLLGSNLVLKSGFPVSVPTSTATLPPIDAAHVVTLPRGSMAQIYFNQHKVTMDELATFLDESPPEIRHVIIQADELAAFGVVVEISNLVKDKGFELAYATTNEE